MECDLLVIGGGIIGSAVAHEAASRGLKTVLLEKSDFGSATSAGSFKIIHGGLRYLQHLDAGRLLESAEEQRLLRKNAPHLVKPLPFIVPCYGYLMKGRAALRTACSIYEFLTRSRNKDIPQELHLPDHRVLSVEEITAIAPLIPRMQDSARLRGGVIFYDCQMKNPDRLTLAVVRSAEKAGATVMNYTEVVGIETVKDQVSENGKGLCNKIVNVITKNSITGEKNEYSPRYVINASGPWAECIGRLFTDPSIAKGEKSTLYFSKGIQLVVPQIISKYALSLQSHGIDSDAVLKRGGRSFFLQPWKNMTLLGTSDTIVSGSEPHFSIKIEEIRDFLRELKSAYPSGILEPVQVRFAFGGLRAVSKEALSSFKRGQNRDGLVNTTRDEKIIDHSVVKDWGGITAKVQNLVSVVGVKYTTFRKVGEEVLNIISKKEGLKSKSLTKNTSLFGSPDIYRLNEFYTDMKSSFSDIADELEIDEIESLIDDYGTESQNVVSEAFRLYKAQSMEPDDALLLARIRYGLSNEYVHTLNDLILRRLPDSSLGFPGLSYIRRAGLLMAHELSWTSDKLESEINKTLSFFQFE
ncbi:MAG TPA: glycerol-3-phosphate dehydrogenase/oxidase [Oligoflexia bacterium]|nr:glycerol-3-phosphate dehydrogenase/oxidase [Oligoflexia bacterium]HMP47563.1 glycerol-3-phosphate dehydrogenase/oxidase [Oligoflexia bacterium]